MINYIYFTLVTLHDIYAKDFSDHQMPPKSYQRFDFTVQYEIKGSHKSE